MDCHTRSSRRAVCALVLILAACDSGGTSGSSATAGSSSTTGGTVTLALMNPFNSYNTLSTNGNSTWNQDVVNAVQPWIAKFDEHANVVVNTDLADVTRTGDRPLV